MKRTTETPETPQSDSSKVPVVIVAVKHVMHAAAVAPPACLQLLIQTVSTERDRYRMNYSGHYQIL